MPRYRLDIAYDGTAYQGWQKQIGVPTVQGEIESALSVLQNRPDLCITGSGRTDTGVHARGQVAHVDLEIRGPLAAFSNRLNRMLPPDIRIVRILPTHSGFHARFDATRRTYTYYLSSRFDPMRPYEWVVIQPMDVDRMREAANGFVGRHDFKELSVRTPGLKSSICEVFSCSIEATDAERLTIVVVADRFLRNMVRRMVGVIVRVGVGEDAPSLVADLLAGRPPRKSPLVAPAKALVLEKVEY